MGYNLAYIRAMAKNLASNGGYKVAQFNGLIEIYQRQNISLI